MVSVEAQEQQLLRPQRHSAGEYEEEEQQQLDDDDEPDDAHREEELLSIRFVLDASPEAVADELAAALLHGEPGRLPKGKSLVVDGARLSDRGEAKQGLPEAVEPEAVVAGPHTLPLPEPIAAEWPCMRHAADEVMLGSEAVLSDAVSWGLRPLHAVEHIWPSQEAMGSFRGFFVALANGKVSYIEAFEEWKDLSAEAERAAARRCRSFVLDVLPLHFVPGLSAEWDDESHRKDGDSAFVDFDSLALREKARPFVVRTRVSIAPFSGGRSTLTRKVISSCSWLEEAHQYSLKEQEGPVVCEARRMQFALEMETRAWIALHDFPLVEIWRGVRRPAPWATHSMFKSIRSFSFAAGHSAPSAAERRAGLGFDAALARRLARLFPEVPKEAGKSGMFVEGNVEVQSFAAVLGRLCRRAAAEDDVFRAFLDLGSGEGHAVLAAHALFPFRRCCGCELAPEILARALQTAFAYDSGGLAAEARCRQPVGSLFVHADFLKDFHWADASVVLANAVTWPRPMLRDVARLALKLKPGSMLLLAVRQLPADEASILEAFEVRGEACYMNFQELPVQLWVYRRREASKHRS